MKQSIARVVLSLLCVALLASCASGGSDSEDGASGKVRFLNTIADQPNLQFFIGDDESPLPVGYGVFTPYETYDEGDLQLRVFVASSPVPIYTDSINVSGDEDITVIFFSDPREPEDREREYNLTTAQITDKHDTDEDRRFELRVVNASPTVQAFDVIYTRPGAITDGVLPWRPGIGFRSSTDYVEGNESPAVITITNSDTEEVVFQSPALDFETFPVQTIVIMDRPGRGQPLQAAYSLDSEL